MNDTDHIILVWVAYLSTMTLIGVAYIAAEVVTGEAVAALTAITTATFGMWRWLDRRKRQDDNKE